MRVVLGSCTAASGSLGSSGGTACNMGALEGEDMAGAAVCLLLVLGVLISCNIKCEGNKDE